MQKKLLADKPTNLLDVSIRTGLSGPSRLHDLFIRIEGMTPGEYKNGGASLTINYSFVTSPFGRIIIASTGKGITSLAFVEDEERAFTELKQKFPHATFHQKCDALQKCALTLFKRNAPSPSTIKLHLKGTDFQLKVWEAVLKIPMGRLSTYGAVAVAINHPNACRAVGTAIGGNPVAFLIPCHRIIQSTGILGNYHWGTTIKTALIGWEAAQTNENQESE